MTSISNLFRWPVFINAALFQITWLACVMGSAKALIWPAILACLALAFYQLQTKRRHVSDLSLIAISIILGLIVDTLWIQLNLLEFVEQRPYGGIAPGWIIILWVGFAMTINHSLAWLSVHPLLPAAMGAIGGPLSYLAGLKLGAVSYLTDTLSMSIYLAIAWAVSLTIMVHISKRQTA